MAINVLNRVLQQLKLNRKIESKKWYCFRAAGVKFDSFYTKKKLSRTVNTKEVFLKKMVI